MMPSCTFLAGGTPAVQSMACGSRHSTRTGPMLMATTLSRIHFTGLPRNNNFLLFFLCAQISAENLSDLL